MRLRPRSGVILLSLVLGAFLSCKARQEAARPPAALTASPETAPALPSSVNVTCGKGTNSVVMSATVPQSPNFPNGSFDTIEGLQCDFDVFSWNSFIALNHSASGGWGNVGGDNPTLWQTWPESSDIFLPDGTAPPPWNTGGEPPARNVPPECASLGASPLAVVRQLGKRPDVLEESDEPFKSGPLVDAHGWYSRFVIMVNQEMYQYLWSNQLYSAAGQQAFTTVGNTVGFPCACAADPTGKTCTAQGQQGAIMVKAAWKILDEKQGDDPKRFHVLEALVYTPAVGKEPASCEKQLLGLVGLHIGHKDQADPQWLWSTFEQVDNVPTKGQNIPAGQKYNYFISDCKDCNPVNEPPPQPWDPHDEPVSANGKKSQVMREVALTSATETLNAAVAPLLAGTVWANYQLISTQWPTNANGTATAPPSAANGWCSALNPVDNSGAPAPTFLANTTLETYIQGTVPQASSSCIGCHLNATMTNAAFSDFTYLLERAH